VKRSTIQTEKDDPSHLVSYTIRMNMKARTITPEQREECARLVRQMAMQLHVFCSMVAGPNQASTEVHRVSGATGTWEIDFTEHGPAPLDTPS
jgi:hypothetical protein